MSYRIEVPPPIQREIKDLVDDDLQLVRTRRVRVRLKERVDYNTL